MSEDKTKVVRINQRKLDEVAESIVDVLSWSLQEVGHVQTTSFLVHYLAKAVSYGDYNNRNREEVLTRVLKAFKIGINNSGKLRTVRDIKVEYDNNPVKEGEV